MVITRFILQRALAFIYLVAFLIAFNQFVPLLGEHGLMPARLFIDATTFWDAPSLLRFFHTDAQLQVAAGLGIVLSLLALSGFSDLFSLWISLCVWAALWMLYLSFVNIGQTFYGFGWESLLLETGFLAIFLGSKRTEPAKIPFFLMRWLLFRVMFGAGLIKMRGDSCWLDLTCLNYHYETQPSPNALSWYFHQMPEWTHQAGVLFNHFVELIVPFGFFMTKPARRFSALITIVFQSFLIASGNLSWLNCITIVLCFACLDDGLFAKIVAKSPTVRFPRFVHYTLLGVILLLSIQPTVNLFSRRQIMNTSFDPLRLVNTYGAFGSVTRQRDELVIEGTSAEQITAATQWQAYEFKAKPGDPMRRPPQVTPYHYKLDWQMWFAAMSPYEQNPWIVNLVAKLLQGQEDVLGLLAKNPFVDKPPRFVRVLHYQYRFGPADGSAWWVRSEPEVYLPALSLENQDLQRLLKAQGWN